MLASSAYSPYSASSSSVQLQPSKLEENLLLLQFRTWLDVSYQGNSCTRQNSYEEHISLLRGFSPRLKSVWRTFLFSTTESCCSTSSCSWFHSESLIHFQINSSHGHKYWLYSIDAWVCSHSPPFFSVISVKWYFIINRACCERMSWSYRAWTTSLSPHAHAPTSYTCIIPSFFLHSHWLVSVPFTSSLLLVHLEKPAVHVMNIFRQKASVRMPLHQNYTPAMFVCVCLFIYLYVYLHSLSSH